MLTSSQDWRSFERALEPPHDLDILLPMCQEGADRLRDCRQRILSRLEGFEPEDRLWLQLETSAVLQSFDEALEWINLAVDFQRHFEAERLSELQQQWPLVLQRLQLDELRWWEACWSVQGPTSHPGINRLLTVEDQNQALALEVQRCRDWQPQDPLDRWQSELQDFYSDYFEFLKSGQLDDEPLLELGARYQRLDLEHLWRRYSGSPTGYPWVNLLIHGVWLEQQGALHGALVERLVREFNQTLAEDPLAADLESWSEDLLKLRGRYKDTVYQALVEEVLELLVCA